VDFRAPGGSARQADPGKWRALPSDAQVAVIGLSKFSRGLRWNSICFPALAESNRCALTGNGKARVFRHLRAAMSRSRIWVWSFCRDTNMIEWAALAACRY